METPLYALVDTLAISKHNVQNAYDIHTAVITLRNNIFAANSGVPSELLELVKAAAYAVTTAVIAHETIVTAYITANTAAKIAAEINDDMMFEYTTLDNNDILTTRSNALIAIKNASKASQRIAMIIIQLKLIIIEHDLIYNEKQFELVDTLVTAHVSLNRVLEKLKYVFIHTSFK